MTQDHARIAAAERVDGSDHRLLLLCDHASNAVPPDVALGIAPDLLEKHIGFDIGAGALTRSLAADLDVPAILGTVSRLVIDLHREPGHPDLIPMRSDGHAIPGNHAADREARVRRFHVPYHDVIADAVRRFRPHLIVALHSFTRRLEIAPEGEVRPWHAGILCNRDDRAARLAIAALRDRGIETGDNQPYSGRLLNATLNRHGEANGIACVSIEVRNDLIADARGVEQWSALLGAVIGEVRNGLAQDGTPAT